MHFKFQSSWAQKVNKNIKIMESKKELVWDVCTHLYSQTEGRKIGNSKSKTATWETQLQPRPCEALCEI